MFKKLQNLLFEDEEEDDDIETEEREVHEAPKPQPVRKPRPIETPTAPAPAPAPAPAEKPAMQRIDVTQPIAVQRTAEKKAPIQNSLFENEEKPVQARKPLGITIDDGVKKPAPSKPAKMEKKAAVKTEKKGDDGYHFQPVISPIFGVDEKDLNALKNTTNRITKNDHEKKDGNVNPIISPMYGSNDDDIPPMIQDSVEQSDIMERATGNAFNAAAEDTLPEFSLDDILKVGDDKFAEAAKKSSSSEGSSKASAVDDTINSLFPDMLFDDKDDEPVKDSPVDETVVLNKNDFKKKEQ
jgi:hypothetical protein